MSEEPGKSSPGRDLEKEIERRVLEFLGLEGESDEAATLGLRITDKNVVAYSSNITGELSHRRRGILPHGKGTLHEKKAGWDEARELVRLAGLWKLECRDVIFGGLCFIVRSGELARVDVTRQLRLAG